METYVQSHPIPVAQPPKHASPLGRWLRHEILASPIQAVGTLLGLSLALTLIWALVDFTIVNAVWTGSNRAACAMVDQQLGACWPFIKDKLGQLMYGFYPADARWRVNLVYAVGLVLLIPLLHPRARYKLHLSIAFFGLFPLFAYVLLYGGPVFRPWLRAGATLVCFLALTCLAVHLKLINEQPFARQVRAFGLVVASIVALVVGLAIAPVFEVADRLNFALLLLCLVALAENRSPRGEDRVWAERGFCLAWAGFVLGLSCGFDIVAQPALQIIPTSQWGGLFVTLVVATTGIVASVPIGIVLALARRSSAPIIRTLAIGFIEIVRGVPLITILFFSTYMLPLFLDQPPDGLVRVLIGVSLFAGAYMAEIIRGGLQAIPKGQYEAAASLGLGYSQTMGLIVLPQAIRLVIPGVVNSFIGLFKDTTLVSVVSIFDLLGGMRAAFTDPAWSGPSILYTGFAFTGMIYFGFCYLMSSYSRLMEEHLRVDHRT
ncbi:amino acid ABC transporter permease [Neorhizobium alkalisoli]|uniref:amino acid ABC transporter permease n=1 Tax=Neorhizobium alkalisoli TaxID=528178 RepID=UPI001FE21D14|nr:amino acid ABC transporter permease [Neorhizobium alkalisoli]